MSVSANDPPVIVNRRGLTSAGGLFFLLFGVLLVLYMAGSPPWLLITVIGVLGALLVFYLLRSFRNRPEPGGQGDFVMGTFQGLLQQLKEKEQELARLQSQAEERARHVESYNENILRSVASGVLTVDRELQVTSFNEAAERILGMPRQKVIGRRHGELFGADHPLTRIITQTLERQEWLSRQELELEGPNGPVWVGMSTSLLRDPEGAILGATVVFTDLTEIKRLQEQMELRRRLSVLGEMSAGIAHEFRNYMGTIMGYARLLAKSLPPDHSGRQMADAIHEELKAMNRLIDDLLQFGRHTEPALSPTHLIDLFKRSVAQVDGRCAERRITVSLNLPDELPIAQMDEGLMYQALLNLYNNAIDAMAEGGTLSIHAKAAGPRNVELTVSDTGVGIPPEHLEKIFLPMFTTKSKGTGLGLALAHKIILSHGGRISVDSKEGSGATFRIVLPLTPPGQA